MVILGATLLLAGCGGSKSGNILGLGKTPPDEFSVVSRAPLSRPPDYALRPPSFGNQRAQEQASRQQTEHKLLAKAQANSITSGVVANDVRSVAEVTLLTRSNAFDANKNIRNLVNQESAALAQEDGQFVENLIFWRTKPKPGVIVDPKLEAKRLRENSALGKPVTEGDTPLIKRKKTGLF